MFYVYVQDGSRLSSPRDPFLNHGRTVMTAIMIISQNLSSTSGPQISCSIDHKTCYIDSCSICCAALDCCTPSAVEACLYVALDLQVGRTTISRTTTNTEYAEHSDVTKYTANTYIYNKVANARYDILSRLLHKFKYSKK